MGQTTSAPTAEIAIADTPRVATSMLRVVWAIIALLVVGMVAVGTVMRYGDQVEVCTQGALPCLLTQRLTPENLVGLADPEAALRFHAAFFAVYNSAVRAVCLGLALLLLWRRPADWLSLLVTFYLLTVGNPLPLTTVAAAYPVLQPVAMLLQVLSTASFGLFLCLFPGRRFAPSWSRWLALVWVVNALASPFMIFPGGTPLWFTLGVIAPQYGATVALQISRYRHPGGAAERQQTKWILFGAVLWFAITLVTRLSIAVSPPPDAPIAPLFYFQVVGFGLAILVWPICIFIAVQRHQLFDIDLLINRALVYAGLTASVVALYVLVVGGLGSLLRTQDSLALSLVATGAVAVLFQPLRERLQHGVDRLLFGDRGEPYAVVARLGKQLEAVLEPDAVLPAIVETVATALKLPYVAIVLGEAEQLAASYGARPPGRRLTVFPLVYQSAEVGRLQVAPRSGEAELDAEDRGLLADLARQAGVAAHAVQLTSDLRLSRERLVSAREEERRRLRRDLHDGLGPALASQALTLDTIGLLLNRDPAAAAELVGQVKAQSQAAISEIRRVVYELRPSALDDLGLVSALREQASRFAGRGLSIRVEAPEALSPLSAAVEVAAYRIAQEALTNVVRHAHALHCALSLSFGKELTLTISDDGVGIPPDRRAGVGLSSMRERAEELGGTLEVTTGPGVGTTVRAILPLDRGPGPLRSRDQGGASGEG